MRSPSAPTRLGVTGRPFTRRPVRAFSILNFETTGSDVDHRVMPRDGSIVEQIDFAAWEAADHESDLLVQNELLAGDQTFHHFQPAALSDILHHGR